MAYQDNDLLMRLMITGLNYIHLGNRKYNRAISNEKEDGLKNSSSLLTWREMLRENFILSRQNITSGKIIANIHKDSIGITKEIYSFEI